MFCRRGWLFLHEWSKWDSPLFVKGVDLDTKGTERMLAVQQSTCAACNAIRYRRKVKWDIYE